MWMFLVFKVCKMVNSLVVLILLFSRIVIMWFLILLFGIVYRLSVGFFFRLLILGGGVICVCLWVSVKLRLCVMF